MANRNRMSGSVNQVEGQQEPSNGPPAELANPRTLGAGWRSGHILHKIFSSTDFSISSITASTLVNVVLCIYTLISLNDT